MSIYVQAAENADIGAYQAGNGFRSIETELNKPYMDIYPFDKKENFYLMTPEQQTLFLLFLDCASADEQ